MFKVLTLNVDIFKKGASCKGEGFWLKNIPLPANPFSALPPPPPGSKYQLKSEISPIK